MSSWPSVTGSPIDFQNQYFTNYIPFLLLYNILVIKYHIFVYILLYMVYKNIQSLASGETKDIIIHIGPILYTLIEKPMHI